MPLRDFFFILNTNITNTSFPQYMPRIAAVDECDNFRKRSKLHRFCYFEPMFYPAVMMFEEVHMPLTLRKQKKIYHIHFLPHRDARDNVLCSTGKETFLTDISQPDILINARLQSYI